MCLEHTSNRIYKRIIIAYNYIEIEGNFEYNQAFFYFRVKDHGINIVLVVVVIVDVDVEA